MSRGITFSSKRTPVLPRPLVGKRAWIKRAERNMRDWEFSDNAIELMYALAGRPAPEKSEP